MWISPACGRSLDWRSQSNAFARGGPGWLDTEQDVIAAKAESPDASWDEVRTMLQTLLADRFKLAVRREMRSPQRMAETPGSEGGEKKTDMTPGRGPSGPQMNFRKMPIGGLVNTLANMLGSPLLDKIRHKGFYDFRLEWTPVWQPISKAGE